MFQRAMNDAMEKVPDISSQELGQALRNIILGKAKRFLTAFPRKFDWFWDLIRLSTVTTEGADLQRIIVRKVCLSSIPCRRFPIDKQERQTITRMRMRGDQSR